MAGPDFDQRNGIWYAGGMSFQPRRYLWLILLAILSFAITFLIVGRGRPSSSQAQTTSTEGMVWVPGGEFTMGTDSSLGWAEEGPAHRVKVDGFWMDATEVTNKQFGQFVKVTGYKAIAEIAPTKEEFPAAPPEKLVADSTVFTPAPQPAPLNNRFQSWRYEKGANWRYPEGPDSDLKGKGK